MTGKEDITIEASLRSGRGKGYARQLRRAGKIPANLLDKGKSTPIELDPKYLHRGWQNDKRFQLTLDGQTKPVLIKELQLDPVKRAALHVDLVYA